MNEKSVGASAAKRNVQYILIPVLILAVGYALLFLTYENVKREMIRDLNDRQMLHAKQAARGIGDFFREHVRFLQNLAVNEHIVALDETGKTMLQELQSAQPEEISSIGRIDSQGRILYLEPDDPWLIAQPLTTMEDFEEAKRTRKVVVSDVFMTRQGFQSIIVQVPVFDQGNFCGTLGMLLPFEQIARRYIGDIQIGRDGYAWVISRNGIEICCPVPGHVGNSVLDNCREYPDIIAMAKRMMQGEQGTTAYTFDRVRDGVTEKTTKHAVFMPVLFANNFWSIVVATPEDEVISGLRGFRNCLLLIGMLLIIGMSVSFYLMFRARLAFQEMVQRKKAEEELERYFMDSPDLFCIGDTHGYFTKVNPRWEETFGYATSELEGHPFKDFVHPDDREAALAALGDLTEGKDVLNFVNRFLCKDGTYRWLEWRTYPSGKQVYAVARDITERRLVQEALAKSEEKFRKIIESSPMGIHMFRLESDDRLVLTGANPSADIMFRIDNNRLIGKTIEEAFPRLTGTEVPGRFRAVCAEGINWQTQQFAYEDGRFSGVYEIHAFQTAPGMMASLILDITERKRAEEELKNSEQLLKSIIQGYPIPAFMIGKDHRVIHWNRMLEAFTGIEASSVIGTSQHWKAFYSEERPCIADLLINEDHEAIARSYGENACKPEGPYETCEATQFFPEMGEAGKWLHGKGVAVRNARGAIAGAIETFEDITDRERAESVLRESEIRYRAIFEHTGTATVIIEEDTTISLVNAEFEKLTGYTRAEIENKKSWTEFVVQEDLERMLAQHRLRRTDSNAAIKEYEFRLIDRDGRTKDCLLKIDTIADTKRSIASLLDITRRKQAEEALVSANRQLNDIIEFLPDATLVIDNAGKVIAWNRAIEEQTGVSKKEMIGQGDYAYSVLAYGVRGPQLVDLTDASDEALEPRYWNVTRKGGTVCAESYAPLLFGGKGAHLLLIAAPLFDAHGNRVGAIESIRDVTDSKKKEEALRESQQQLADIINFLPDATMVIDRTGAIIAWNRAMEEMTGIRAADMLGKGNFEHSLPFYGKRRPMLIDLVFRPLEEAEGKYEHVEKKGTVLVGEVYTPALKGGEAYLVGTASALFDSKGNTVGAIESIRDISGRRLVEEALLRAEEKYRDIFENSVTGIYQVSLNGDFIKVNAALARIHGYDSPDEMLRDARSAWELHVRPESRPKMLRLIEEHGSVREFEAEFYKKDRSVVWVSLNVRTVRNQAGEVVFLEGTANDITDRKLFRSRIEQMQKMEAIGTLAGGIAHDFNNILAPIIGYSELALHEIPADTPLSRKIDQVLRSGYRARDLVKQILTFGRKTEQERRPVQVSLIVKETYQMLRSTLPSTIEIRRSIDEDAANSTIMADPTQIHQVLMNLCTNAAHAMRLKGGVLSIALAGVDIDSVSGAETPDMEDGPYLRLSVSDTGHGMSEEVRQRIFDPYFTTKGPDEGTGLGLAVVYGIVKDLSGGITVASEPGEGATFHVFFPITETNETVSTAAPVALTTGKGRILVVDDEKYIVEMLTEMLGELGYDVTARYSSSDALEAFQTQPARFDLIISDQTMPHMTGTDLAKEILKIRPDIPIILCTGFSATIDVARAAKLGIKAFLMKPVALQQLADEIHKLLKQG